MCEVAEAVQAGLQAWRSSATWMEHIFSAIGSTHLYPSSDCGLGEGVRRHYIYEGNELRPGSSSPSLRGGNGGCVDSMSAGRRAGLFDMG